MSTRPDRTTFQSGDFIWPKNPRKVVIYRENDSVDAQVSEPELTQAVWEAERQRYLDNPELSPEGRAVAMALDYISFLRSYMADQPASSAPIHAEGAVVYVGHVGIVEVDADGQQWVVEALMKKGVVRHTYDDWLGLHAQDVVWHGRLKGVGATDRAKIAAEARQHIGKPYNFWNFDLLDDSAFYCSKLVWLAVMRSLCIPLDGRPKAQRWIWFSPKQMMRCDTVNMLFNPADYGPPVGEVFKLPT